MPHPPNPDHRDVGEYVVRVQGHLSSRWAPWFDDFALSNHDDGTATLEGRVADQAALHGLLQRVRDLGVPLVSVRRVDTDARPCKKTADATGEPTDP